MVFPRQVEVSMVLRVRVTAALFACLGATLVSAQDRITTTIDARRSVLLRGSTPPQAQPKDDLGEVPADFALGNMTLMFRPSAEQQAALEQLLAEQQDPASPNYHTWLTPEQYADRFAPSAADVAKVADWLRGEGFSIRYTARGRDFINFSGTAATVKSSLHTAIHRYSVRGETHFANANDVILPAAIQPLVAGILGLHDIHPKAPRKRPVANFTASNGSHYLLPDDFAAIYDLGPMYSSGYAGAGQSIVIVGQSDIDLDDINVFRATFGLPVTNVQVIPTGGYPGFTGDEVEADLDLEWAGAIARDANLIYVYSDDVSYAAYYAIDNNLAPVVSESFGLCEYSVGINRLGIAIYQVEAQKGNAMGITWLASSGDSGAAGCDYQVIQASQGLGVSMPASVPEVTAVGGTEFVEGTSTAYWSATNGTYNGSALSYIPETSWNDTVADLALGGYISASGGGVSSYYAKPTWQTGPGVPSDGKRDVPDIALTAADAHDPYLIVTEGIGIGVGGTSASAPSLAGVLAVLNQYLVQNKVQSKPGLGNINPKLYSMAAGSSASKVFHDVTTGNNIVPCQGQTQDCLNGQFGYNAGPGYDLVTGLGSVDAYNFIAAWSGITISTTTTTVTASPNTILPGGSTVLTATVKANGGSAAPTGTVTFSMGPNNLGAAPLVPGSNGSSTATWTVFGGQLTAASTTVQAFYAGNPAFNASSGSTTINLGTPSAVSKVNLSVSPNPVVQQAPDATGATFVFTVQLTETAGVATTLTNFTFAGVSYAASIPKYFGSTALPANGTLKGTLKANSIPVPSTQTITFNGRDVSGATWTQQMSIQFTGK